MGGLQLGVNKMLDIVTNPEIDLPKTVFAETPHHSRNANTYSHIYTPDVIDALAEHGFKPVAVSKRNVRKADRFGFEKHLIRFRRTDAVPVTKVGDTIPEFRPQAGPRGFHPEAPGGDDVEVQRRGHAREPGSCTGGTRAPPPAPPAASPPQRGSRRRTPHSTAASPSSPPASPAAPDR